MVALQVCAGLDLGNVRTRARLADGVEHLAFGCQKGLQEAFALFLVGLCGQLVDGRVGDVHHGSQRQPGVASFFHEHGPGHLVHVHPAQGLGQAATDVSELGQLFEEFEGEGLVAVVLGHAGCDLAFHEAAHAVAQHFLFGTHR